MRVTVRAGADRDGVLMALAVDVLANAGAYGNHTQAVLEHSCNELMSLYRCPNTAVDVAVAYTNTVPAGAFRGYGLGQTLFALEQAVDALAADPGRPAPAGAEWCVGQGVAMGMLATAPRFGHRAESRLYLAADGGFDLHVGTAEFGNGTSTTHCQVAAAVLETAPGRIRLRRSDTDLVGHDTGAFGSTRTVVAAPAPAPATETAALALRERILLAAAALTGRPAAECRLIEGAVLCGNRAVPLGELPGAGAGLAVMRKGGRDAALHEAMRIGEDGTVGNPAFRHYHILTWADVPPTEVLFADTSDAFGPMGAKSMSESPFNPVGAAMPNALADATGVRLTAPPFTADRVWAALNG